MQQIATVLISDTTRIFRKTSYIIAVDKRKVCGNLAVFVVLLAELRPFDLDKQAV